MRALLVLLFAAMLGACRGDNALALYFTEQEHDSEPATTRMLVTDGYLRIDYGQDADDFILLDRKAAVIYSINHSDKTILVIKPLPIHLAKPKRFTHGVSTSKEDVPPVGDKKVNHFSLSTNGQECYDLFAADGLLPEAVQALREYHTTIAGEHAAAMQNTPDEMRVACDLANYIFEPARHLAYGFPVRQKDMNGNVRQLVDYKQDISVDASVFKLPEGYRHYSTAEMRGDVGS